MPMQKKKKECLNEWSGIGKRCGGVMEEQKGRGGGGGGGGGEGIQWYGTV